MTGGLRDAVAVLLLSLSLAACAGGRTVTRSGQPSSTPPEAALVDPNGGQAPAFSPDGKRIAFLSSTLHTPSDLWVMNADGSAKTRVTTRGATSFRWASDGAIHVVARRKGYEEVLSVDVANRREERVSGLPPNASLPLFSPDGALFAFTAPGAESVRDLWIGTADKSRLEAVTEKIHVRSFFWGPEGRTIFYEPGKTYGLGLWRIDLATMEARPLVVKYIGTPRVSVTAERVAYPYPTKPGEFEVHTMKLDGSGLMVRKAPHLGERWLAWAPDGTAVHYLGTAVAAAAEPASPAPDPAAPMGPHPTSKPAGSEGATALWRLDLETGSERRLSPEDLHVVDFAFSPDGASALVTGLLPASRAPEVFRLDLETGNAAPLTASRSSAWMPVPSPDATRIAYVTNEGALDTVHVADLEGNAIAAYPGFVLEQDARVFWLPKAEGLLVVSGRGLHAFSEKGPIGFPDARDHRGFLHADVSIQDDKVAISAIPRYGETPGLYVLDAMDGAFVQTDLRYPASPERAAARYLHPRWSLDGRRIAFTDGTDVWTMNADGTARRRLTAYAEANEAGKGPQSVASFPVWSVRGQRVAYTLTVYAEPAILRQLWVVEADGSSPRLVFSEEVDSLFQVFLPEYTTAPFFDASDTHVIATGLHRGLPNVISIELASGKATVLTETGGVFPAMLPEEDSIVYTSLHGNDERIWIMNADGTGKRPFLKKVAAAAEIGGERAPAAR